MRPGSKDHEHKAMVLRVTVDVYFVEDVADALFDGVLDNHQARGDSLVGAVVGHQLGHLAFARGEVCEGPSSWCRPMS